MKHFKIDPHVHTSEVSACGLISGRRLAELYKNAGYGGIVITDHFCPEFFAPLKGMSWGEKIDRFLVGYHEAAIRGRQIGLTVFFGIELTFPGNHDDLLVYGIDGRFLKRTPFLLELGLEGLYTLRAKEGFLVYQAHPFRPGVSAVDPRYLDGIEVYNGNPRCDSRNHLAEQYARRHSLRMISGSDCHHLEDVGRGGIVVGERIGDVKELAELLRKERIQELIGIQESIAEE